jgi:parallel beta-helix repeat protein
MNIHGRALASTIRTTVVGLFALLCCGRAHALDYYVSPSGNDQQNDGHSVAKPLRTIQRAADLTQAGDVVNVMNGVYRTNANGDNLVSIVRSGAPNRWITYRAYPGHRPRLVSKGWSAINVSGAAYIVIEGFELIGNAANITLADARAQRNNTNNPMTSGNGIFVGRRFGNTNIRPHHVIVRGNQVSKFGGGGIGTFWADYVTIEDNVVFDTSFWAPYANSGISLYQNWNSDNKTGYKNFIRRNVVYRNRNYIPNFFSGPPRVITDGNGIIVDDSRNTQGGSPLGVYRGRTLIENNIAYDNGGRGIHVYSSDHVDIVNNTAYRNSLSPEIQDTAFAASDVGFVNNIAYARSNRSPVETGDVSAVTIDFNLFFGGTINVPIGANNIVGQNPLFANVAARNFRLQTGSPAVDTGTATLAAKEDFERRPRPQGSAVDRGAFEKH